MEAWENFADIYQLWLKFILTFIQFLYLFIPKKVWIWLTCLAGNSKTIVFVFDIAPKKVWIW